MPIDPVAPIASVTGGTFPRVAFSSDHYAVAWVDPAEEIYFSELCPL